MDWITGKRDDSKKLVAQLGDPSRRAAAASELIRQGSAAVDALTDALASKDASMQTLAAQILVKMGTTAVPRLSQLLGTAHPATQQLLTDILGEIRHRSALPALTEAARREYFTVRARAASAMARIGDSSAVPTLIALLADDEPTVRIAAALAVGAFHEPSSIIRLSDVLLEDREIEVRQAAAEGLAATRLKEAIPYFIEAMADSFWWYERENAAEPLLAALTKFGADAVEPLVGALTHYEATVRRSAAVVLGRIGDTRAVEALGMTLYDMHDEVGHAAAESLAGFGAPALGVLSEALNHPEAGIRLRAVSALTRIRDPRVLPLLAEMLHDHDRLVLKQVIQSLGELRDPRAVAALTPIADNRADRELSMLAREAMRQLS
ncbi:MAG: HEAT repeat domain-containing protein [Anaerolineaceae bacterium]|nr:MAG: HEAT repeat domain-containing protein [Anaerolineaceae bacterium]